MQTVTKLLLFAMFAIAARYETENFISSGNDAMNVQQDAGRQYAMSARRLLSMLHSTFCKSNKLIASYRYRLRR
jgi:hypothetical protein